MSSADSKIWRVVDLLEWSKQFLSKKGIPSPQIEAEFMLRDILNKSRMEIYLSYDQITEKIERKTLKDYLLRRVSGEPIQYILGYTEFMGHRIKVTRDTLIPRHDTEVIVDDVYNTYSKDQALKILDLCTGSGCIAVALALKFPSSQVTALDVSQSALTVARENVQFHQIDGRIQLLGQDLLKNQQLDQQYDLIISNPPYISGDKYEALDPLVKNNEPYIALNPGADEFLFYRIIAQIATNQLTREGLLYVEIGGDYQVSEIKKIFIDKGLKILEIINDYNGIARGIKATK